MMRCDVDRELINTAMSRARQSVAVVGDPIVLCTFGSCRTVWQQMVKHAAELDALYPPEQYSMESIRREVQQLSETEPARKLLRLLTQYRQFQAGLGQAPTGGRPSAQTAAATTRAQVLTPAPDAPSGPSMATVPIGPSPYLQLGARAPNIAAFSALSAGPSAALQPGAPAGTHMPVLMQALPTFPRLATSALPPRPLRPF